MEKSILIPLIIIFNLISIVFSNNWNIKADGELGQTTVNGESVREFTKNVSIYRDSLSLYTDKAIQYLDKNQLHLTGNTKMINGSDTLRCNNMIFWMDLDSITAQGNVIFNQKNRILHSSTINYWKTNGFRGSSFEADQNVKITENERKVEANKISYNDNKQQMKLEYNASVSDKNQSLNGENILIQYADSLIKKITIDKNAYATQIIEAKVDSNGIYQKFINKMNSSNMNANFKDGKLLSLILSGMAETNLNVLDDSLFVGKNIASGDSINALFKNDEIKHLQVIGGAQGKFIPEAGNANLDSIVTYKAGLIDYDIILEKSILKKNTLLNYQNSILKSGEIIIDWKTSVLDAFTKDNEVPSIKTGNDEPIIGNNFTFNLNTKHGVIDKGKTTMNNSYYQGEYIYRDEPNIIHVDNSIYTSCDLDEPHYFLGSKKMKMIPGDRIIARPLWLHIHNIPIIGIPLAVFPNKSGGRRSGWIMPSFGSTSGRGTFLRNLGYFWAPNDYIDSKTMISFYDKKGLDIRNYFSYKKRYKYNGSLNASYFRDLEGTDDISKITSNYYSQNWDLKWRHNHKIDPTQNLNINYTYVSSSNYYQRIGYDLKTRLKQQINSSLNYSKNWPTFKNSLSLNISETYDLLAQDDRPQSAGSYKFYKNRSLPNISFRHGHSTLFGLGDSFFNSIYWSSSSIFNGNQKIGYLAESDSTWSDTTSYTKGIKHNISLSAPQKIFKWLSINPKINLKEDWVFEYREPYYDENKNFTGEYKKVEKFKRRLTGSLSISANTKLYGIFPLGLGNYESIRHVLTPSLSYSYKPDFSKPILGFDPDYILTDQNNNKFFPFEGSTAGKTSISEQKNLSISFQNLFQMKLREDDKVKKVDLVSWKFQTNYNAAADSLKWSVIRSTFKTTIPGGLKLDISATHEPYVRNENGIRINQLTQPYLTKLDASTSFRLSGNRLIGFDTSLEDYTDSTDYDDELLDLNESGLQPKMAKGVLWQASFSLRFSKQQKRDYTNIEYVSYEWDDKFWINTNLKIMLSQNWKLSYSTRFNVIDQEMLSQSFHLSRPLHCWMFSFKWWPSGGSKGFLLNISVKNPDLQDIKVETRGGNKGIFGM